VIFLYQDVQVLTLTLKRQIKKKEQFPNEQSAERFLVNLFTIQNEKLQSRIMKGFDAAYYQIQKMFDDRY
jgi:putative transposase